MSLRVWLPLTKDLRQQGLSNVTVTNNGATFNSAGKLGGCYNIDNTSLTFTNPLSSTCSEFSVCGWVNLNSNFVKNNGLHIISWGGTYSRICVSKDGAAVKVLLSSSAMIASNALDSAVVAEVWNHYTVTFKNGVVCIYINGILDKQTTIETSSITFASTTTTIGNHSSEVAHGKLNDFRLYDHCLSPMEVKEIAKGLVLHYPLNRQGWGQENLLPCGGTYTQSSPWTTTLNRTDGYAWVTGSAFEAIPGKTYTISVECDGNLYFSHGGTHNPSDKHWTFWLYICNTNTSASWQTGSYDTPVCLTNNNYNYRKIGNTHVWTYTLSSSQKYISLRTNSYSDGSTNLTIKWWNMKIEEGDKFTGWSPNSSSTLATTMGLNSTTEYDCSGFCNNGNKMTNTITYTSDTAKYAVSTHFNGTYDGILIENLQLSNIINSAVTYAFWIKPESESGARSVYFGSYNTGPSWSIEKTAGNVMRSYWNGSPDETCSGATITDGVWQHVCLTKNGTNDIKVYINGVQKWASTATHSNLNFPTTFRIGRDTRSNDGTPYKGLMSDFRIYATALSADDVKSLYQNCATIDPDGTIRGQIRN